MPSAVALPFGEQKYVFCESAGIVLKSTMIDNITCFITSGIIVEIKGFLLGNKCKELFQLPVANIQKKWRTSKRFAIFFIKLFDISSC